MSSKCISSLRAIICILLFAQNTLAQQTLLLQGGKFDARQFFEVVEVIDARHERENVGQIYYADTQQSEAITTAKPLAEFLEEYFVMCSKPRTTKSKCIIKINYLEFGYRKIKDREYVWAYCDYEVFSKREGGVSLIDRQTAAVEGKVKGNGFTMDLAKLNWLLWNDAFWQIADLPIKSKKDIELLPVTVLQQPINSPAIIFTDSLQAGIYANYEELMQNKPSITDFKLTKYDLPAPNTGLKQWVFEIPDSNKKKGIAKVQASKIWGYCENSRIYVQVDARQFIEIEPLGTSFETSGMAIKGYQTGYRTQMNNYGWSVLGAYSRLYSSLPGPATGFLGATALVAIIAKLASDPNQRAIVTEKGWRPIPIYELK
jgi:hypothetical protein